MADIRILLVCITWLVFISLFSSMCLMVTGATSQLNVLDYASFLDKSTKYNLNYTDNNNSMVKMGFVNEVGNWELVQNEGLHAYYLAPSISLLNTPISQAVCEVGTKYNADGLIYENLTFKGMPEYANPLGVGNPILYINRITVFKTTNDGNLEIEFYYRPFSNKLAYRVRIVQFYYNNLLGKTMESSEYYFPAEKDMGIGIAVNPDESIDLEYRYYVENDTIKIKTGNAEIPISDVFNLHHIPNEAQDTIDITNPDINGKTRLYTNNYAFHLINCRTISNIINNPQTVSVDSSVDYKFINNPTDFLSILVKVLTFSIPDSIIPLWLQFITVGIAYIGIIAWIIATLAEAI